MKILYIIGNGFDINLGLNTRYSDFYEYYQAKESDNELIVKLKNEITSEIVNWSDLELALGRYTKNLNDVIEFDQIYEDLVDNLDDYLDNEEQAFDFAKVNKDKFLNDLSKPELFLTQEDIQELTGFKNTWGTATWKINIITLNYTRVIEKILENDMSNRYIGTHPNGKVTLGNIQHIHGYTDERTIMGVNDVSQIENKDFHTNQEILEALIKPSSNRAQRHNIDRICETFVQGADLICIFGSSLGDTDNYWWELIGKQLRRNTKLIIFSKGEEVKKRFAHKPARSQREIKNIFLSKTDLNENEKQESLKNIYIGINTNMFHLT